jgi:hypothetical protein
MKIVLSNLESLFLIGQKKDDREWTEIILFLMVLTSAVYITVKADMFIYGYLKS